MGDLGVRAVVLVAAVVASGLMAGVFALYAHTLMPGLRRTDDRTFVAAFRAIDRAIINPWFLAGGFLGAPALTLAAAVLTWQRPGFAWVTTALALHAVVVVVTFGVHLPLNDAIKAVPEPVENPAAVRQDFREGRWARWNLVRVLTSIGATACLAWALALVGRAPG